MNPITNQITSQMTDQAPFGQFHGTSLLAALGNMAIFAFVAIVLLFIAVKAFDKAITRIDLEAEVAKGNVAAGIVVGAIILATGIIIALAMM